MPTFEVEAMVRGYHVYEEIWDASIDEKLLCAREHEVSKFSLKYKDPRNISAIRYHLFHAHVTSNAAASG